MYNSNNRKRKRAEFEDSVQIYESDEESTLSIEEGSQKESKEKEEKKERRDSSARRKKRRYRPYLERFTQPSKHNKQRKLNSNCKVLWLLS